MESLHLPATNSIEFTCLIDIGKDLGLYTPLGQHCTTGATNYQVIIMSHTAHILSVTSQVLSTYQGDQVSLNSA